VCHYYSLFLIELTFTCQAIYTQSKAQFNTYVSAGTLLNNYAHIFDLLIRLRQAVDHPYLVIYSKSNPAIQVPQENTRVVEELPITLDSPKNEVEILCGICHESVEDKVTSECCHDFCRGCVEEYIASLLVGMSKLIFIPHLVFIG